MSRDVLSVEEIHFHFRGEWILIEDPEVDKDLNVLRGRVVFHSKDRDEVDRKAIELRLKHSAFLYTGTMPDDTAIVL
jgi:hypothetical protein